MSVFQETPGVAEPMPEQSLSLMAEGAAAEEAVARSADRRSASVLLGDRGGRVRACSSSTRSRG